MGLGVLQAGDQHSASPYAYPAYDTYDSGSGPFELNDGDLLAPALLNAAPTVRAFYSLQRVRPQLIEALTVSEDLCSQRAALAELHELAPQVSTLRILDVLAWKVGRRAPADDAAIPD